MFQGKIGGQNLRDLLLNGSSGMIDNVYFDKDVRRATRVFEHLIAAVEASKYRVMFGIATG